MEELNGSLSTVDAVLCDIRSSHHHHAALGDDYAELVEESPEYDYFTFLCRMNKWDDLPEPGIDHELDNFIARGVEGLPFERLHVAQKLKEYVENGRMPNIPVHPDLRVTDDDVPALRDLLDDLQETQFYKYNCITTMWDDLLVTEASLVLLGRLRRSTIESVNLALASTDVTTLKERVEIFQTASVENRESFQHVWGKLASTSLSMETPLARTVAGQIASEFVRVLCRGIRNRGTVNLNETLVDVFFLED